MNRPSSESNQTSLNCRVAREIDCKSIDPIQRSRSLREIPSVRKEGDSNPRYGNPYGSLANCWFQPLTHPSLKDPGVRNRGVISLIAGAKVLLFFEPCKFLSYFFYFSLIFLCRSGIRDSNPRPSAWEANALPTELIPPDYVSHVGKKKSQNRWF